jgi:hypothetical protein
MADRSVRLYMEHAGRESVPPLSPMNLCLSAVDSELNGQFPEADSVSDGFRCGTDSLRAWCRR